jgi:hypothetical protein
LYYGFKRVFLKLVLIRYNIVVFECFNVCVDKIDEDEAHGRELYERVAKIQIWSNNGVEVNLTGPYISKHVHNLDLHPDYL